MVTAPRAFLVSRSKANEWTITVHRDLEDLLAAWQRRSSPDERGAILHLGVDRPPASECEKIVARFPGKILLTAPAKLALPTGFHASREPVGVVAEFPVHLGTRGWGYLIDDDAAQVPCDADGMASRSFEGWVREFVEENPGSSKDLSQARICNEADYLANEVLLPSSVRQKTGAYRFGRLRINVGIDPCAIALASPPWLSARTIDTIGLPPRVANMFAGHGIATVGDLARSSMPKLLQLPNCRRTAVRDLCNCLESALREGPANCELNRKNEDEQLNLLASIRRSLSTLRDRDRDIVLRRLGFLDQSDTLKQLADDYGVTKERVRQIELKAKQKLVCAGLWDDILNNKLQARLHNREHPLPIEDIEADSWFEGVTEFPDALRYILENLSNSVVRVVTIDGVGYFAQMSQSRWEAALTEALRLLESAAGKGWLESDCRSIVGDILPEKSREFRALLWEKASTLAHFASEGDGRNVLASYGRGVDPIVEAVLAESDRPLHFSKISALATERAGRSINMRKAHKAAASVGHLLGYGIYGVDRHLPKPEILQKVSDEAEDIIASEPPGRHWHASEILGAIIERESCEPFADLINKYIVDIALRKSGDLRRLGRMMWTGAVAKDDVSRIDLRRGTVSLLQKAGRPLHTDEIRRGLMALCGVSKSFRFATMDPVLRVGVGLWGLNDRDISIKRPDQPRLLDGLVAILKDRGIGIHVSELGPLTLLSASGLSAQTLFSLASGDSRIKVSVAAQYLYLAEWDGPRRESMSVAVRAVLTSAAQPLVLADILLQVEKRMQRMCNPRSLVRCLRALEADADPSREAWSLNAQTPRVEEDLALAESVPETGTAR